MSGARLVEACVQTVASAREAARVGAGRIELCSSLDQGGLTPSAGLMRVARRGVEIPMHVLIRPRGGDFIYDSDEVEVMLHDIREARRAGADGVVIGALLGDGTVDRAITGRLAECARPLAVTFHRAIDHAPDLGAAVATVVELGIERVLTSGGPADAEHGVATLARLVSRFGRSVTILAGGGIRPGNARQIAAGSGVPEVHLGPRHENGEFDADCFRAVMAELGLDR
jgi:copper homeostasis protein